MSADVRHRGGQLSWWLNLRSPTFYAVSACSLSSCHSFLRSRALADVTEACLSHIYKTCRASLRLPTCPSSPSISPYTRRCFARLARCCLKEVRGTVPVPLSCSLHAHLVLDLGTRALRYCGALDVALWNCRASQRAMSFCSPAIMQTLSSLASVSGNMQVAYSNATFSS